MKFLRVPARRGSHQKSGEPLGPFPGRFNRARAARVAGPRRAFVKGRRNAYLHANAMSDSQRFPVAAHALAYLAHKGAFSAADAAPSAVLAASIPTNPVVVRRVTALLAKAGLIATRPGASGGAWLLHSPEAISLETVLRAVNGCAHLGSPPAGAKGCPVSEHIPRQVARALTAADQAAGAALSKITIADLLDHEPASLAAFPPHPSCPVAA
jgi:DNA-binding IscR family transcriptional regulator